MEEHVMCPSAVILLLSYGAQPIAPGSDPV